MSSLITCVILVVFIWKTCIELVRSIIIITQVVVFVHLCCQSEFLLVACCFHPITPYIRIWEVCFPQISPGVLEKMMDVGSLLGPTLNVNNIWYALSLTEFSWLRDVFSCKNFDRFFHIFNA